MEQSDHEVITLATKTSKEKAHKAVMRVEVDRSQNARQIVGVLWRQKCSAKVQAYLRQENIQYFKLALVEGCITETGHSSEARVEILVDQMPARATALCVVILHKCLIDFPVHWKPLPRDPPLITSRKPRAKYLEAKFVTILTPVPYCRLFERKVSQEEKELDEHLLKAFSEDNTRYGWKLMSFGRNASVQAVSNCLENRCQASKLEGVALATILPTSDSWESMGNPDMTPWDGQQTTFARRPNRILTGSNLLRPENWEGTRFAPLSAAARAATENIAAAAAAARTFNLRRIAHPPAESRFDVARAVRSLGAEVMVLVKEVDEVERWQAYLRRMDEQEVRISKEKSEEAARRSGRGESETIRRMQDRLSISPIIESWEDWETASHR